jgi:hypothetical protein
MSLLRAKFLPGAARNILRVTPKPRGAFEATVRAQKRRARLPNPVDPATIANIANNPRSAPTNRSHCDLEAMIIVATSF